MGNVCVGEAHPSRGNGECGMCALERRAPLEECGMCALERRTPPESGGRVRVRAPRMKFAERQLICCGPRIPLIEKLRFSCKRKIKGLPIGPPLICRKMPPHDRIKTCAASCSIILLKPSRYIYAPAAACFFMSLALVFVSRNLLPCSPLYDPRASGAGMEKLGQP